MNENWKFSDIPYTRPDVEALQARYDALTRRARDAAGPEELLRVVRDRDALQQEVSLCQSIATIRAFHDVTDAFYQTEFQETLPRLETLDSQSLAQAIVESPYAQAVDEAFGPQLRRLLALDHRLHTGGKELQARISQLSARYQQITASAKYQVQGETLSGGQLRAAQVSPDRDRRKAAFEAERQTVLAQADTLEQLLRDLVRARNDLARANGFDNFADYGDLAMQRVGYGRVELDVAASPNKISGMGFCEELAEPYRMPFVFANCSGTASDVTVYTHELGHGLQGYLSAQAQPVSDYIGLSPDLAEVHSKTMELLSLPYAPGVVEALAQTRRHQPTP